MKYNINSGQFVKILSAFLLFLLISVSVKAQYQTKWMAVGSLHNWYSEIGCEIEEGLVKRQQYGLRWPAIYRNQDIQAAKGLWLGVKEFTDETGKLWSRRVAHVGPRVSGANEFFPVEFTMQSKLETPTVSVDGVASYQLSVDNTEEPDINLPYDRVIYNKVNTILGLTYERKIIAFSQPFHDNYIIHEVTVTNTGNTDGDADIELPNQNLKGVYIYYHYRLAVSANSRYVIGNATGWGINTMVDTRGDGVKNDADADFRAQYVWHGKYPPFVAYDNIGGPIWNPDGTVYTNAGDTVGRLGASQFAGVVTLHADTSPLDMTDDILQPMTTSFEDSDHPNTSNNDSYNETKMQAEYDWMSKGHANPRHADKVEPSGNFAAPTADPSLGTSGGFSAANGYGPYDLDFGQSVTVVWAEAVSGLSWEKNILYGKQYKRGSINALQKNQYVLTGKDSLFKSFRRAVNNYKSGYSIPKAPYPPKFFNVNSGGDRISLSWELYPEAGPTVTGFEIYRATGQYDSTYYLIYQAGADETSYDDKDLLRGVNYYYYIVSVGDATENNGVGNTPLGKLRSSRYATQTYDPANLKRPAGNSLSQIRIVPNPFVLGSDSDRLRFPDEPDKLAFFNIPGVCTIQIYTEVGELIYELEHSDGSGDAYWNCVTSSNQVVVSGIYIAVITDKTTGERAIEKFAVIR